jgi:transporter family-2 protein
VGILVRLPAPALSPVRALAWVAAPPYPPILMNMMTLILGFCIGVLIPVQAGANGRMIRYLGHPVYSGLWNFASGAVVMAIVAAAVRYGGLFASSAVREPGSAPPVNPWWAWCGGAMGAVFVTSSASLAPKIGALMLTVLLMAGQLVAAAGVDHFGAVGFPQKDLSPMRIAGVLVVVLGVAMVYKGSR